MNSTNVIKYYGEITNWFKGTTNRTRKWPIFIEATIKKTRKIGQNYNETSPFFLSGLCAQQPIWPQATCAIDSATFYNSFFYPLPYHNRQLNIFIVYAHFMLYIFFCFDFFPEWKLDDAVKSTRQWNKNCHRDCGPSLSPKIFYLGVQAFIAALLLIYIYIRISFYVELWVVRSSSKQERSGGRKGRRRWRKKREMILNYYTYQANKCQTIEEKEDRRA